MLRVITATVPESDGAALRSLLEDQELIANWQHSLLDGLFYVHLLVRDDRAELLLDLLEQRFGTSEQFRAVILRVHATVPALEEEGEEREEQAPPPGRVARAEIQSELESGIDVGPIFLTTVILSAVIAAVGLFRDNVAVIIGAMVVAPLLKPTMAIAFALTVGEGKGAPLLPSLGRDSHSPHPGAPGPAAGAGASLSEGNALDQPVVSRLWARNAGTNSASTLFSSRSTNRVLGNARQYASR